MSRMARKREMMTKTMHRWCIFGAERILANIVVRIFCLWTFLLIPNLCLIVGSKNESIARLSLYTSHPKHLQCTAMEDFDYRSLFLSRFLRHVLSDLQQQSRRIQTNNYHNTCPTLDWHTIKGWESDATQSKSL
jgi:hypothetical protein